MNISYDKKNGLLSLHTGFNKNESFETNVVLGDVVLDISTQGRVCGLEILDVKRFLLSFLSEHEAQEIVDNLVSASFTTQSNNEHTTITLHLKTQERAVSTHLYLEQAVA